MQSKLPVGQEKLETPKKKKKRDVKMDYGTTIYFAQLPIVVLSELSVFCIFVRVVLITPSVWMALTIMTPEKTRAAPAATKQIFDAVLNLFTSFILYS